MSRRNWWDNNDSKFNTELDKLSNKELNFLLKEKILETESHVANNEIHTTKEEKEKWNSFKRVKLANEHSAGLISQEEKNKLNAIADHANRYIHPKYKGSKVNSYLHKVSREGHITDSIQTECLNITVNNVSYVNGLNFSKFIPAETKNFYRLSSPDIDVNNVYNLKKLINVKTLKNYAINSAISIGDSFETADTRKLFYNRTKKKLYYFKDDTQSWENIYVGDTLNKIKLDKDGKIDKSFIRSFEVPLGTIITIGTKIKIKELENYLLCDGSTIHRNDYPELFKLLDKEKLFILSYTNFEKLYETKRNKDTEFKSWYSFVRPKNNDKDSIILPNLNMVNVRASHTINSSDDMFRKESGKNIHGEFPTFDFYDSYTNTIKSLMPVEESNENDLIHTVTSEGNYIQNPFDEFSATTYFNNGSYYSIFTNNNEEPLSTEDYDELRKNKFFKTAIKDGYLDRTNESKVIEYSFDNANTPINCTVGDHYMPDSNIVLAFIKVK